MAILAVPLCLASILLVMAKPCGAQEAVAPEQIAQDQVPQNDASPDLLTPSLQRPQDGDADGSADDPDAGPNEDPVWAYFLGKAGFLFYRDIADLLLQHFDLSYRGDAATARDQLAALLLLGAQGDQYNGISLMEAVLGWFNSWHLAMQEDQAAQQQQAASGDKDAEEDEADAEADADTAWATGSLNPAQMATIACVIYGSDPTAWRRVVDEGLLPPEQAADCAAGYADLRQGWARSLAKAQIAVASLASAQIADTTPEEVHPVTLQYRSSADPAMREIADWVRSVALFDGLVRHVNEAVKLPDPLGITLDSCGPLTSASSDETPELIDASGGHLRLCYEVLSDIYDEASTQNVEAPPE